LDVDLDRQRTLKTWAERRGLVSPSITRAAIIAFRRELAQAIRAGTQIDEAGLRAESQRIDARIARLRDEIKALEARKAEIAQLLAVEPNAGSRA
jgi:hypothetical protein